MDSGGKRIPRPGNDCVEIGRFWLVGLMMAVEAFVVEFYCLAEVDFAVQGSIFVGKLNLPGHALSINIVITLSIVVSVSIMLGTLFLFTIGVER